MTAPRTVVLSLAPLVEDRLLPQLIDAGVVVAARPAGTAEAAALVPRVSADLVLASASTRHLDAALIAACRTAGVRLVVLADGPFERDIAAALGVLDPLDGDAPLDAILAAADRSDLELDGSGARRPSDLAAPAARPGGSVVAVWGPTGAPGRTTTAITLAVELAATGARVALVDADSVGAAVAPSLGLFDEAPGFAAACRLAAAGALTSGELDRVAQRYRFSRGVVSVLTGIGRPARWPELSMDRVTRVLEQCRSWADVTVVDAGFNLEADEEIVSDLFAPRRNAATIAAVRAADHVVAVGAADPVGLARFVRSYGDLIETLESPTVSVVITKVRASAVGLNPGGQVRATLLRFGGIDDVTLVPWDAAGCDAALLTGRALSEAAPRSPAVAALRRLAADRLAVASPDPVARRRLRRPRVATA
ncbi:CpaE family protein [uncultured Amnibacterium sp.]|uniref:AAA family ATPase n=1 Tax=uncultured Amnibacterium sp. TaxID=1631851 RepID=UPI0035CADA9D